MQYQASQSTPASRRGLDALSGEISFTQEKKVRGGKERLARVLHLAWCERGGIDGDRALSRFTRRVGNARASDAHPQSSTQETPDNSLVSSGRGFIQCKPLSTTMHVIREQHSDDERSW
jgi:hypothetical protein